MYWRSVLTPLLNCGSYSVADVDVEPTTLVSTWKQ